MPKFCSFIDKTDKLWYNTDMNTLVYAGCANPADGKAPHTHNGYEIICFSQYGEVECGGRIYAFSEGDAAVIPPLTAHNTRYAEGSLRVILEQTLLPVRTIKAIKASCSEGLFDAVKRASAYFNGDFAEKGVLLAAYGNLIAAFVSAYSGGKEHSPVVKVLMENIDLNFGDQTFSLENAIRALPLNYDWRHSARIPRKKAHGTRARHNTFGRDEQVFGIYHIPDCRSVRLFGTAILFQGVQEILRRVPLPLFGREKKITLPASPQKGYPAEHITTCDSRRSFKKAAVFEPLRRALNFCQATTV